MNNWKTRQVALLISFTLLISCQRNYIPKPHAYYRIDFPEKEYRMYDSICPFSFEYPLYGTITPGIQRTPEPCCFNIHFPRYKGTIYLTYKEIDRDFNVFIEDNWKYIFTIAQRADAVDERKYENPDENVYGMIYDQTGSAASQVQFYVTDSVKNFLRGSLYFYTSKPNYDSLAPVIAFFREDIMVMMESFRWKEKEKSKSKKSWD